MKKMILFWYAFLMYGCSISPKMIPDTTGDSAMLLKIKHDIENGKELQTGYAWILWYLPILFLVCAWGYRELIAKKPDCAEKKEPKKQS